MHVRAVRVSPLLRSVQTWYKSYGYVGLIVKTVNSNYGARYST